MKRKISIFRYLILTLILCFWCSDVFAYEVCKYGDKNIKWNASSVTYYINTSGGPSDSLTAIQNGMNTWTNVSSADFTFVYGGTTTSTANGSNDGYNIVTFGGGLGSGTLAVNTTWYSTLTGYIVDSDIKFNTSYTWGTTGSASVYDVQNIGTHEFGHTLCLKDLYSSADSEKTMYGYGAAGETKKRTLDTDDISGIAYLYPASTGGLPTAATLISPSGTITTTTPTYTWNAVSTASYYQLYVNGSGTWYTASAAGCSSGSGTCSITGSALTAGSYTWYVQTYNSYGYGPWSSGMGFTVSNLPPSCPDLYSWNGGGYLNNGSLYTGSHSPEQEYYQERLVTQPVVERNNTLTFMIKEVDDEISHINSVAMYYRNSGNSWAELDLIYAVHNKAGDVRESLRKRDNNRAYTAPGDEILLTYRVPLGGVENAEFKSISSGYYLWSAETWCQILDLGPAITVQPGVIATLLARINNMSAFELPEDARVYFNIQGPGGYSSNNIFSISVELLAPGNPQWYSINWTVPDDAPAGQYYYSASVYIGKKNITWARDAGVQDIPTVSKNKQEGAKAGSSCQ